MLPVDLKLSIIKPLGVQWMIKQYNYLKSKPDIVQNGFKGGGIRQSQKLMYHALCILVACTAVYIYIM